MIIIVYLVGSWETFHRRPMLEALARQALGQSTIFCINPPISISQAIYSRRTFNKMKLLFCSEVKRLSENLYVGTPVILWPGAGRRWQDKDSIGRRIVSQRILKNVRKIETDSKKIVSWVYRPEQIPCLGLARENFAVYECYDEYSLSHIDGSLIPGAEDKENDLIGKVDLIFTTSYSLFESRRKKHPNVHYAPNGVDFDLFNKAAQNKLIMAKNLKKIPSPRVGYIGNLSGRIDFNLIENITKYRKTWSIILIGPVEEEAKAELTALKNQPNVYYLGYKTREILPEYLKGFDVCILPFKVHSWNEHSNPLKLWEYLAAGKPVVSTPTKEMETLREVIWLGEDHVTFISAIKEAIFGVNESRVASGIEIAKQHSWDNLTCKMFEAVKKSFNEHKFTKDYIHIKCNLCGKDNAKVYSVSNLKGKHVLHRIRVKCKGCGLVYSNPQATEDKMTKYYSEVYPDLMQAVGKVKEIYDESFFLDSSDSTQQMRAGKFLDVGCAHGFRVKTAERLGWESHGVEISISFCDYAKNTLGLKNIFNGKLSEAGYEISYFDYVVVWHVLEHVPDPMRMLKEIERIVRPGGKLLIGIPNILEPIYQITRISSWLMKKPYPMATSDHHTYEFTPITLRKSLKKACPSLVEEEFSVYYHRAELDSFSQMDMNWKGNLQKNITLLLASAVKNRIGNFIRARYVKKP